MSPEIFHEVPSRRSLPALDTASAAPVSAGGSVCVTSARSSDGPASSARGY